MPSAYEITIRRRASVSPAVPAATRSAARAFRESVSKTEYAPSKAVRQAS